MIEAKNINKYYGAFQALNNVSFNIQKGEIIGFIGKNGAGKTTLMRIITSFLAATDGTLLIDGIDIKKNSLLARKKIGYLPETPPLYTNMTVKDYLKFAAQLKDIRSKAIAYHIDRVLEECKIEDVRDKTISKLSKGYKQRVGIAQAILNDPEILILDEPTSGLDPIQVLQVRRLIKSLEHKRTVILSTHVLSEIENLANRFLIIQGGSLIADETQEQLSIKYPDDSLEDVFLKLHGVEPKSNGQAAPHKINPESFETKKVAVTDEQS